MIIILQFKLYFHSPYCENWISLERRGTRDRKLTESCTLYEYAYNAKSTAIVWPTTNLKNNAA